MIKAAKAEALIRRVLQSTPPGLFQHMMRTINSQVRLPAAVRSMQGRACPPCFSTASFSAPWQVLVLLDTKRSGYVDLALLIMCLLALW